MQEITGCARLVRGRLGRNASSLNIASMIVGPLYLSPGKYVDNGNSVTASKVASSGGA